MLLSEYGGGRPTEAIRDLLWRMPLAQALVLYPAIAARYGNESKGPTFVERAMSRAKRAVEERWKMKGTNDGRD